MTQIGSFTKSGDGFHGCLQSLSLDVELCIVGAEPSESENAPEYRIHLGADGDGPEVGAGWKRTGEKAGAYIALLIDDPSLTHPIRANLFQSNRDDGVHHLLWSRPARREAGN